MADLRDVTTLLAESGGGDLDAAARLVDLVYPELRRLAQHYMQAERQDHTLQATALVHEVYMRLFGGQPVDWRNRAHFFAVAAQQMRRILVDHARASRAAKRGGERVAVPLENVRQAVEQPEDLLELHEALERLQEVDPRAARVVELRYFGGLSEKEAAEVLGISVATLKRDFEFARVWLLEALRGDGT